MKTPKSSLEKKIEKIVIKNSEAERIVQDESLSVDERSMIAAFQLVVNKINEIIDFINSQSNRRRK